MSLESLGYGVHGRVLQLQRQYVRRSGGEEPSKFMDLEEGTTVSAVL